MSGKIHHNMGLSAEAPRDVTERTQWDDLEDKVEATSDIEWSDLKNEPYRGETRREMTDETEDDTAEDMEEEMTPGSTGAQAMETDEVEEVEDTNETYRPIDEMEKSEVAREYMDLLQDLSGNFTSPEAVHSAVVLENGAVRDRRGYSGDETFVKDLYRKNGLELDESNNMEELRNDGKDPLAELKYENADLNRAHTLRMVDDILAGEEQWQEAGREYEKTQATLAEANEDLVQLNAEREKKGFLEKLATAMDYWKQKKEIKAKITQAQEELKGIEGRSQNGNATLARSLEAAYSEDYHYGHHKLSYEHDRDNEYKEKINEEYNDKFFGADDPVRQEKVRGLFGGADNYSIAESSCLRRSMRAVFSAIWSRVCLTSSAGALST